MSNRIVYSLEIYEITYLLTDCVCDFCLKRKANLLLSCETICFTIPGAAKSNHLKLFAVFSATAWNFNVKFYRFMSLSYPQLSAKRNLIIFKYDEIIDILAWPSSDFARWKTLAPKLQQNSVTKTTQWTMSDAWQSVWCWSCSSPASAHLQSSCEASISPVDLLLWQTVPDHLQRFLEFADLTWVLDGACDRPPTSRSRRDSPWVRRIWRPLIVSDEFWAVDLKPFLCDACLSLIAVVERDTIKF